MTYPVLVLGGYGNFGGKISESLAKTAGISVTVAGRSKQKCDLFVDQLKQRTGTNIDSVVLDINQKDFKDKIARTGVKLVVHSSGPFQGQNYDVAQACIESGLNYIDLADGRNFVRGFGELNAKAIENNVLAITGASSVPGLSSAVVNEYLSAFKELREIHYGIAPGNRADRGEATVKAILSYTGRRFKRLQDRQWEDTYGWQEIHRHRFPNPIGRRWLASCDIPDLELFPDHYPNLKTIKFYAGLELGSLHLGLWLLSWFSRLRIVDNWSRYSKLVTRMSCWFQGMGTDIGGMYIQLNGVGLNGQPKQLQWNLVAEEGHGPEIPTIPSIILAKKIASGSLQEKGAKACVGLFSLTDFKEETKSWNIWQQVN